jgi:hypothetical protein
MSDEIEISLVPGEQEKIDAAKAALAADAHAPREVSVRMRLHQHNEYPMTLYKGQGTKKSVTVNGPDEEDKARADGYGAFVSDHEAAE